MAIPFFKKKPAELPFDHFAEYYIGADVVGRGSCQTDQDIYIDGTFDGEIKTTGLIELAKNSVVTADIDARTAIIEGKYKGNITTLDELHIKSCSTVSGKLQAPNLIIDKGAIVNSAIKMERN